MSFLFILCSINFFSTKNGTWGTKLYNIIILDGKRKHLDKSTTDWCWYPTVFTDSRLYFEFIMSLIFYFSYFLVIFQFIFSRWIFYGLIYWLICHRLSFIQSGLNWLTVHGRSNKTRRMAIANWTCVSWVAYAPGTIAVNLHGSKENSTLVKRLAACTHLSSTISEI